jgi:mRNA interferase MazF
MSELVRRGDVFMANLDPTIGVEIKKKRPVIVVSNDTINQFSRLVIVVPLTTNIFRLSPSHVLIPKGEGGLGQDSQALTEQIRANGQTEIDYENWHTFSPLSSPD